MRKEILVLFALCFGVLKGRVLQDDRHRPKLHFSIASNWINDPNGMVYLDGEYHLHYQYHPEEPVWGPMHWGHSVSRDLVTWTDLPIALYPDPLGAIFSGSAVADLDNSTGFQQDDVPTLVAIFTHAGASQQQSIAYSVDKGRTWEKYAGNPVIPNPDIPDFRDPKVIKYDDKWILLLAAGNKIMFYSSTNLKEWEYLSEFGADPEQGSHGGVWECPDLFPLEFGGETVWILIVSINPGGPNGGSATQYFVGGFDGVHFSSSQIEPLWMDWGVDNYAAVSFFNEPSGRVIMMGWMNNWDYANNLPTSGWRGQMTLPRVMGLSLVNGQLRLNSNPAEETRLLYKNESYQLLPNHAILADEVLDIPGFNNDLLFHADLTFDISQMSDGASLAICFMNQLNQEICTGLDKGIEQPIFLNREMSGNVDFHPSFSRRATASRESLSNSIKFEIFFDVSAAEVYVDGGVISLTALYYPDEPYNRIQIRHHASGHQDSRVIISQGEWRALYSMDEVQQRNS